MSGRTVTSNRKVVWNFEMCVCSVTQSCLTLCNSKDCSPPGSSVYRTSQARILWWIATVSSRGSSWPRECMRVSYIAGGCFTITILSGSLFFPGEPPGKPRYRLFQTSREERLNSLQWKQHIFVIPFCSSFRWNESINFPIYASYSVSLINGKYVKGAAFFFTSCHSALKCHSVLFSRSVVSNSLWPQGLQHARPPCPSPAPGVYSNSCPLSWWCHPTISSSVTPFSSCLQSFPASRSFQMSQLFATGGQNIGVSASATVHPMNTKDWFPLGWTDWISHYWVLFIWGSKEAKELLCRISHSEW